MAHQRLRALAVSGGGLAVWRLVHTEAWILGLATGRGPCEDGDGRRHQRSSRRGKRGGRCTELRWRAGRGGQTVWHKQEG
jgi:hypothetical protein